MKKFIWGVLGVMIIMSNAVAAEKILPQPEQNGGMPIMDALRQRRSGKSFAKKDIDEQTLSNILWAAYGVNDDAGRRTIPTAMNKKELDVYVADANGVWLYDAEGNKLKQISDKNILEIFNTQDYMADAPAVLIYTADKECKYGDMHAGSAYQNVSLYTTSAGMHNVVRGMFDKEKTVQAINLPESQRVIITQAIGWKK